MRVRDQSLKGQRQGILNQVSRTIATTTTLFGLIWYRNAAENDLFSRQGICARQYMPYRVRMYAPD